MKTFQTFILEDYGRGDQKGSANIRGKSYFDSSVGRGWISALKDTILGHIMVGELVKAFPGLKKSDIKPLLKSSELRNMSKDWMLADRDIKKVLTQILAKVK
jgi:hypothetical protein